MFLFNNQVTACVYTCTCTPTNINRIFLEVCQTVLHCSGYNGVLAVEEACHLTEAGCHDDTNESV